MRSKMANDHELWPFVNKDSGHNNNTLLLESRLLKISKFLFCQNKKPLLHMKKVFQPRAHLKHCTTSGEMSSISKAELARWKVGNSLLL